MVKLRSSEEFDYYEDEQVEEIEEIEQVEEVEEVEEEEEEEEVKEQPRRGSIANSKFKSRNFKTTKTTPLTTPTPMETTTTKATTESLGAYLERRKIERYLATTTEDPFVAILATMKPMSPNLSSKSSTSKTQSTSKRYSPSEIHSKAYQLLFKLSVII